MSKDKSSSDERSSLLRSPLQRKEILRKVIDTAESLEDAVCDNTIQTLDLCMEQTDSINSETTLEEKIHNQEEVLLDSKLMSVSSRVLKQCTQSLTRFVYSYNHAEFAQKLVEYVKQLPDVETETPNWSVLESQVTKCFRTAPQYTTLLGTLAPLEMKEVNQKRKPIVRETQAAIKRPENVVTVDKEEESLEQTVKMKGFITRYYKSHREPIDFFKLILHPRDFGKTIENMLQISFLVRDGQVKISKDSSGILVVQPCSKDTTAQIKAGKVPSIQNVMYLTMEQWRVLKDTYRLKKPMIDFDN